ncbi:hypothetical protein PR202_gb04926 [Eleusine coracana subsp. coracana]|uniref:Uncharacterized protein n=1 Tax=Eleusine coracana subsp. coracana TaxID=191504 RepID=A0AAV5E5E0_ELECO|nr:hypothetical protein PR202_gb04926 [Eleusine coracana subsp. coracana]
MTPLTTWRRRHQPNDSGRSATPFITTTPPIASSHYVDTFNEDDCYSATSSITTMLQTTRCFGGFRRLGDIAATRWFDRSAATWTCPGATLPFTWPLGRSTTSSMTQRFGNRLDSVTLRHRLDSVTLRHRLDSVTR